ncbi:interleukin-6 receptor subunit beta isoform X2 [Alosa pseudoharengus]|uniref:interleukin-6 receptor subunit beta isoform X2 n=1 Tax=Alosa pseudoharengus TaxID=34774 RepID=UPI003F8B0E8C
MAIFLWLLSVLLLPSVHAWKCIEIVPDSGNKFGYPVELGKEFTATCILHHKDLKAENIHWTYGLKSVRLSKEYYRRINESAGSITVNVTEDMMGFFKCVIPSENTIYTNCSSNTYGILLDKGYPPEKPTDVKCQAVQDGAKISSNVTCHWNPGTRDPIMHTKYTLYMEYSGKVYNRSATKSHATMALEIFPHHLDLKIWVEVENRLGKVTSDPLMQESENLIKTDPPSKVKVTSEDVFPMSLLIQWTESIHQTYVVLKYNIRYCEKGSHTWTEVPQEDTKGYMDSFRLQALKPYTKYVVQVRCKSNKDLGYWSDWSRNATASTPEDRPYTKPVLWMNARLDDAQRTVQLLLKKPVVANGKILHYEISVVEDGKSTKSSLPFDDKEPFQRFNFTLQRQCVVAYVNVTAKNSAGESPPANLAVLLKGQELPAVDSPFAFAQDDFLWVEWSAPKEDGLVEYVLEWVSLVDGEWNWQKEPRNATKAYLKGNLQSFVPYNVTVVPIYHRGWRSSTKVIHLTLPGNLNTITAYLKEGPPEVVPEPSLVKTWKNSAQLVWPEIPLEKQRGFITNYTIVYEGAGKRVLETVVPLDVHSFTLKDLTKETSYSVYLVASTAAGSTRSTTFTMTTQKYDPGEIEMIVVSVCFGFLFLTILFIRLCFKNKETLKKKFWPQVPDPYNSTVATWSPDLSARTGTPKEAALGDLSVVEVDVFDQKSLCDEDKTSLPALKKDKYLSEEHSSGIGGSSCMSSPRQSVSDSDEADSGQTTASTVQYSSVVGYKGQTPAGAVSSAAASSSSSSSSSSPATSATAASAHTFARSESTQPLLDCEEQQEGSANHHHPPGRGSLFRRHRGFGDADSSGGSSSSSGVGGSPMHRQHPSEQDELDSSSLEFCPAEEASLEQPADQPADARLARPPYMPQQSGYRPQ